MIGDAAAIAEKAFRFRVAMAFVLVWVLSLAMPALYMRFDPSGSVRMLEGYKVLAIGWIALTALQPGWLANPLAAAMLVAWTSPRFSDFAAGRWAVGVIVATVGTFDLPLRADFHHHEGFGPGCWIWMANNLLAATLVLRGAWRGEGA